MVMFWTLYCLLIFSQPEYPMKCSPDTREFSKLVITPGVEEKIFILLTWSFTVCKVRGDSTDWQGLSHLVRKVVVGLGSVPEKQEEEEEEEEVGHHVSLIPSCLHLPVVHPAVWRPDQPTSQLILSIKMQQWELQPEVASKMLWITDLTIVVTEYK